jgi:thymidylate synthase
MSFVHNVNVDNVNEALQRGLMILTNMGTRESSRNGPVAVMDGPVMTIYKKPYQRVLFNSVRNANPFFHLFESLWMLAGRNDLPWLAQFNKQMATYSDDGGQTQPAAYGYRWRNYFGYDQIEAVLEILRADPNSRRAVLGMWDSGGQRDNSVLVGVGDLTAVLQGSADVPCNTNCFFRVRNGALDMMVNCRSNDILWGAYGANCVHFSVLLEYMAGKLGLRVGAMYQNSFNFHVYLEVLGSSQKAVDMMQENSDLYNTKKVAHTPLFGELEDPLDFDRDLLYFMHIADPAVDDVRLVEPEPSDPVSGYRTEFFLNTVTPMLWAWGAHKRKEYAEAELHVTKIKGEDWRIACKQWIEARHASYREKANG